MPKGKKLTKKQILKIKESYQKTQSYRETAKETGVSVYTVKKALSDDKGETDDEQFSKKAGEIIGMGLDVLHMRIKRALDVEKTIADGTDEVPDAKNVLKVNEITSAIGALYDKKKGAEGDGAEDNEIKITVRVLEAKGGEANEDM